MNIIQDFIPSGRGNRPGLPLAGPKYITIHDTANPAAGADALMHSRYLKSAECAARPASWHFTADDQRIVQNLPLDEVAWHAGDGHGPGNMSSIAIEICENADGNRAAAEANAVQLVADLLHQFNLPIDAVVQHNHWSGKNCPHIIRARSSGWDGFIAEVMAKMEPKVKTKSTIDKAAAEKVIEHLGTLYMASADKGVQAAAHFAANALRDAAGIPR